MLKIRIVILLLCVFPLSGFAQNAFDGAKQLYAQGDFFGAAPLINKAVAEQPDDPEVLYYATSIYSELESHDTAVIFGSRLYAENNDEPRYVQMFAVALTRSKQPLEAIKILRRLQRKTDDVRTSLLLVNALIDADSLESAELLATTAKKKFPNSADAYFALGLLYYKYKPQPVLELAVQNLEEGLKLDNKFIQAHFTLGEAYWRMANRESDADLANELFKRSLVEWNKVTELEPKNARAWFEQGKIFYLSEKWKDAIKTLLSYRELRPVGTGNPIASWYIGTSYFKLNMCDSAQIHLTDAATAIDTLRSQASLQLGRCKFLSKDWNGAVAAYDKSYEKGTFNTWESNDAWFYGASLVLSGDTTRGIAIMTDASIRDPKQCGFMFRFGVLLQKRQPTFSTKIFRQRLEFCNDSLNGKIHLFIGNNFFADSVVDSAIIEYEAALAIEPGNGYYLTRLAETYSVSGNEPKAREIYQQVIDKGVAGGATDADKQAAISAAIKMNGLDVTAKQWGAIVDRCKSVLPLDAKNKWVILYMAIGYQGGGSSEDACKWYRELLKVDPANETAKKNTKALGC